jgi:type III restriction enzyme
MSNPFFERPILNSPYERPTGHWELDPKGQLTQKNIDGRHRAEFLLPIPKPKKTKGMGDQRGILLDDGKGLSTQEQQYDITAIINAVRQQVDITSTITAISAQSRSQNRNQQAASVVS